MHHVPREALRGEVARGLRARSAATDDAFGALELGLDPRQCNLDELGVDVGTQEIVPDERVAGATSGELFGAPLGEAAVVEKTCSCECRESLCPLVLGDSARG
jgi:hypothetical protein